MKRDMKLIREMLERVECLVEGAEISIAEWEIDDYPTYEIQYNARLCAAAGLFVSGRATRFSVSGMTWAGHNLLDRLRGVPKKEIFTLDG